MNLKSILIASLLTFSIFGMAKDVAWYSGGRVSYSIQKNYETVVAKALKMFESDMQAVTGRRAHQRDNGDVEIYQLNLVDNKEMKQLDKYKVPYPKFIIKPDAFWIGVRKGKVIVVGSNGRGTAYGILELSRLAGVSPWIYWGDVKPERKQRLTLDQHFETIQSPSVEYRGVSIDDEDWSSRIWARRKTNGRSISGTMGPTYYHRLFELLLRLRGNTLWPAGREGTVPFFKVKGNKEVADSFGIFIGPLPGELMLHNTAGKRDVRKPKNKRKRSGEEKKNSEKAPQVFFPYQDGKDVYESEQRLSQDVCLMWSDDNYGYMTRLPDAQQQMRRGGGGVYYHLSYCGAPHDYLWLTTTQPGLIYHELRRTYDHNVRRLWIAGIHDPKVAAYDLSLFMDMAWNTNSVTTKGVRKHMSDWLVQQFGEQVGSQLVGPMTEFYRLCGIRRPEFMGWNQVGLHGKQDEQGWSPVHNTPFNADEFGNELERYLTDYDNLKKQIEKVELTVRPELKDAFFAAVKYPVFCAAAMATKQLQAQEARLIARPSNFHNDDEALESAVRSWNAYMDIRNLTEHYNKKMANGKWDGSMDMAPRNLYVFQPPSLPGKLTEAEIKKYSKAEPIPSKLEVGNCVVKNASEYNSVSAGAQVVEMLGHSMKAIALPKGGSLNYKFYAKRGKAVVYTALIPTHAGDMGDIRYSVSIDGGTPVVYSLKEPYHSERWKQNVLRGQTVHSQQIYMTAGTHTMEIKALDHHIIVDQWMIDYDTDREFYIFPTKSALR
ncbi:MAG: glycosyl hydrolase 115 family protein [Prevotella sp.]|jgi:hypothetical protein